MARHPKNASEAVGELGIDSGSTAIAVAPDHGYVEALSEAVGEGGKVIVVDPPPEEELPKTAAIVESLSEDASGNTVIAWVGVTGVRAVREMPAHVAEGGTLWLVLPRADRDERAPVTEGEVRKLLLPLGWRGDRVVTLSPSAFAVRFHRRG